MQETPPGGMMAGLSMREGGGAQAAREDALARLRAMGWPQRRDEYWKFTRPDTLTQPEAQPAAIFDHGEAPLFDDTDRLRIVFVDGEFDAEASDDLSLEGVSIERLAAADSDLHWARDLYGALEKNGQTPVQRPLAALNTAFASDGGLIHATGQVSKPITLVYNHHSETSDAMLPHVVQPETGA